MKECHRCSFHAELMAGRHKTTPWAKTPCATCPAADTDGKGRIRGTRALRGRVGETRLSLDHETREVVEREAVLSEPATSLDERWDSILHVVQRLLDLDAGTREIVLQRLSCTGTIKDMADAMGISNQAAHARMKAAMRKHAWVAELITIKERKEAHD
jgi:hypothetical protein